MATDTSVRRFDPRQPLPPELLDAILKAAALTRSTYNLQPWRFLVVRSTSNKRKLLGCTFGPPFLADAPAILIVLAFRNPHRADLDRIVDQAGELGALSPDEARARKAMALRALEDDPDRETWAARMASMAASSLVIAADRLGVASEAFECRKPEQLREAFGIPDDHAICGMIALGFASEAMPFPGRLPLEEIVYSEHFGQPWASGDGPTHS